MSRGRHDDIININVGGKRFTLRRRDLLADPNSRLAEWFRPTAQRAVPPTDKGGNIFLDRDPQTFRHILAYLRLKRDEMALAMALPCQPDDLFKLVADCEALRLIELRDLALGLLGKYHSTDEQHYVTSYVQSTMHNYESWQFEKEQKQQQQPQQQHQTYISDFSRKSFSMSRQSLTAGDPHLENDAYNPNVDSGSGAYDEW